MLILENGGLAIQELQILKVADKVAAHFLAISRGRAPCQAAESSSCCDCCPGLWQRASLVLEREVMYLQPSNR